MDCKSIDADTLFRLFTACPNDPQTLLIDVRSNKDFKKHHIQNAYNVRVSTNGRILADYSKANYDVHWSQDCWWGKIVFVYGAEGLKKDHPVLAFLVAEGRCSSVRYFKDGFDAFEKQYPFICTSQVKGGNSIKRYPAQILPGLLYLGDWGHAQQVERLQELNISRVVTIHNNPDNLHLPSSFKHLKFELPDVDTMDISCFFQPTYEFIEQARDDKKAVLVHCGAGVSRSAALVIMYLMRRERWSAAKAREHCLSRRSLVCPNDGFWRTLCALEGSLGIADRSDPTATAGGHGADAAEAVGMAADAAGEPIRVRMVTAKELKRQQAEAAVPPPVAKRPRLGSVVQLAPDSGRHRHDDDEERRGRSRRDEDGDGRGRDRRRDGGDDEQYDRRRREDRDSGRREEDGVARRGADRDREGGHGAVPEWREVKEEEKDVKGEPGAEEPGEPAQEWGTEGTEVVLEVLKEGVLFGELHLGPMKVHQQCVFGRAPTCDVPLEHLSISRAHAQISVDLGGGASVMDLGSGHGTKVDDTWIIAHKPRPLKLGTAISFGASTRTYKVKALIVHKPK